jgi:hypothetical protein
MLSMFQKGQRASAAWGALVGAVAITVVGFSWGGWHTGGGVRKLLAEKETTTMVDVLVPGCKQRFMANAEAVEQMAKSTSTWSQGDIVTKFVKDDDSKPYNSDVATACAAAAKAEIDKAKKT